MYLFLELGGARMLSTFLFEDSFTARGFKLPRLHKPQHILGTTPGVTISTVCTPMSVSHVGGTYGQRGILEITKG